METEESWGGEASEVPGVSRAAAPWWLGEASDSRMKETLRASEDWILPGMAAGFPRAPRMESRPVQPTQISNL